MIEELSISHYKSIFEGSVRLKRANVLVGKNGSGKSNIVDALAFLSDIANEDLDYAMTRRHGADSIRQYSKYKPYHVTIEVKIRDDNGFGQYRITFSSSRNSYRIIDEMIEWNGKAPWFKEEIHTLIKRNRLGNLEYTTTAEKIEISESDEERLFKLDGVTSLLYRVSRAYHDLFFFVIPVQAELRSLSSYSIFPNTIRAPQAVSRSVDLEHDGSNIAAIIKQLTPQRRKRLVKDLRVVLPSLVNITTKSAAGYYVPSFLVRDKVSGETHELNMSQISDGTLRILGILVALNQNNAPSKIILEEPEQMIHPALLQLIKDAIDNYLNDRENGQVFVTTHSSLLMDLFKVSEVIAVQNDGHSTQFGEVSLRQKTVVAEGLMTLGDVLLAEGLDVA